MYYTKPDKLSPDQISSIEQAQEANSFSTIDLITPWLHNEDIAKWTFVIERELLYEDSEWDGLQSYLIMHEIYIILYRIEKYLAQDLNIQWTIAYILNEILKNSVDHAKSDAYVKLEVSVVNEWLLVTFIVADKGPGIKQHLINLFSNQEFIDKYSKYNDYRQQIIKVITAQDIDEYYRQHLAWNWITTRVDSGGGAMFGGGRRLSRAIDELGLDIILRDREYEHTFSNRGAHLSHDTIRDLPYNLVYYWAKFFPKKLL